MYHINDARATLEILLALLANRHPEEIKALQELLISAAEAEAENPGTMDPVHLQALHDLHGYLEKFAQVSARKPPGGPSPQPRGAKPWPFHVIDGGKR